MNIQNESKRQKSNLHTTNVDSKNGHEEEHLKEEVCGEADDSNETELLNSRVEGEESESGAKESAQEVLGHRPSLFGQT